MKTSFGGIVTLLELSAMRWASFTTRILLPTQLTLANKTGI